jgi:hypothetical protein
MGGNNPIIVWDTPKISDAAILIVQSAFSSAGQHCTSARRLIVKSSLYDAVVGEVKRTADRLIVGAPIDEPAPFMGPVIDNTAADALTESFVYLLSHGGKPIKHMVRTGAGQAVPGTGDHRYHGYEGTPRHRAVRAAAAGDPRSTISTRPSPRPMPPASASPLRCSGGSPQGIRQVLCQHPRRSGQLEPANHRATRSRPSSAASGPFRQPPPDRLLCGRLQRLSGRIGGNGAAPAPPSESVSERRLGQARQRHRGDPPNRATPIRADAPALRAMSTSPYPARANSV